MSYKTLVYNNNLDTILSVSSDGNTLYGTMSTDGLNGYGNIFSVSSTGTNFTILYSFNSGTAAGGTNPTGGLTLSGTTLYGTTTAAGANGGGTIFSIQTNGTGFTVLRPFNTDINGYNPTGGLTLSGTTLYGTTTSNGAASVGTIFSIQTNGTGFTVLRSFATGTAGGGTNPTGGLTLSGTTLYGTTTSSGAASVGTIFSIQTNGTGFTVLRSFATGTAAGGASPTGRLILSGTTLYGITRSGGANSFGTIFSIQTNGTGFTVLRSFATGTAGGGTNPTGGLTLSGTTLYGITTRGGANGLGTIYSININSPYSFTVVYPFNNSNSVGFTPIGKLILSGSTLYGTFRNGGNGGGTIFSIPDSTSSNSPSTIYSFLGTNNGNSNSLLVLSGNILYGTIGATGVDNVGAIFSVPTTGNSFTVLRPFNSGTAAGGINPTGGLTLSGTTLYGTTIGGGTIFSIQTNGTGFTVLRSFATGTAGGGTIPTGGLTLSGTTLYGTTTADGANSSGTIYFIQTNGTGFTVLYPFINTGINGYNPTGRLILSGTTLYGITRFGGANSFGTIYSIQTNGTGFTVLRTFNTGASNGGTSPTGGLTLSGTTLYGMTTRGGANTYGTIYSISTIFPYIFTVLYAFDTGTTNATNPSGKLILNGSILYGVTSSGGENNVGTIFSISTTGSNFTLLYSFNSTGSGGTSPNSGLLLNGNSLYGGALNALFSFNFSTICFDQSTQILCFVNDKEVYLPISECKSNMLVKTYNHGYLAIKSIGSNIMNNDPDNWQNCMYMLPQNTIEGQINDLIITGGHSILVNSLTQKQLRLLSQWWVNGVSKIDDKYRLISSLDDRFIKMVDRNQYTYYHLILDGSQERYGIYANGILTETCTPSVFKKFNFTSYN